MLVKEIAQLHNVSTRTVQRWLKAGKVDRNGKLHKVAKPKGKTKKELEKEILRLEKMLIELNDKVILLEEQLPKKKTKKKDINKPIEGQINMF